MDDSPRLKIDFRRQIRAYTAPRGRFELIDVPVMQFLMIDGHGDPNTSTAYADAVATIYPVAYALKFSSKNDLGRDYAVMPLEALWWSDDMTTFTEARDKSSWDWTLLSMIPDWITAEHFAAIVDRVGQTGRAPVLDALRLESLAEGAAVQTLHIGSYDAEGPCSLHCITTTSLPSRSK